MATDPFRLQVIDLHNIMRPQEATSDSHARTWDAANMPLLTAFWQLSISLYINTHQATNKFADKTIKYQQLTGQSSPSKSGFARWFISPQKTIYTSFRQGCQRYETARSLTVAGQRLGP